MNKGLGALAVLMLLLAVTPAGARQLSHQEALQRLKATKGLPAQVQKLLAGPKLQATYMWRDPKGNPTLYLFKPDGQKGFVVIPADDIVPPLIGYSEENSMSEPGRDSVSSNWIFHLGLFQEYSRQIQWARKKRIRPIAKAPDYGLGRVAPKMRTKWSQHSPYNDRCPVIGGKHAVTGCTPTALAQLVKYYAWPAVGTGVKTYSPKGLGRTLSFDFGQTRFDYTSMLNIYDSKASAAQKNAVATLMLGAGVGDEVTYGVDGTTGSIYDAGKALIENFRYRNNILECPSKYFSLKGWAALIHKELTTGNPLIYSVPGHTAICDGYENGYFHFNWGWGGSLDGYFLVSVVCDYTDDNMFEHYLLCRVAPDRGGQPVKTVPFIGAEDFLPPSGQISLGSLAMFKGSYFSYSIMPISVTLGVKAVDGAGHVTYLEEFTPTDLTSRNGRVDIRVRIPSGMTKGVYAISPAFRDSEGKWHEIPVAASKRKSRFMVPGNSKVAFFSLKSAAQQYLDSMK